MMICEETYEDKGYIDKALYNLTVYFIIQPHHWRYIFLYIKNSLNHCFEKIRGGMTNFSFAITIC